MSFNALQLRKDDYVLVEAKSKKREERRMARVVLRRPSVIGVRFANSTHMRFFDLRTGFDDILSGARLVDGQWQPL